MKFQRSSQPADFAGWEFPKFLQWDIALLSKFTLFWWENCSSWTDKSILNIIPMFLVWLELDLAVWQKFQNNRGLSKIEVNFSPNSMTKSAVQSCWSDAPWCQEAGSFYLDSFCSEKHGSHSWIYFIMPIWQLQLQSSFLYSDLQEGEEQGQGQGQASFRHTS